MWFGPRNVHREYRACYCEVTNSIIFYVLCREGECIRSKIVLGALAGIPVDSVEQTVWAILVVFWPVVCWNNALRREYDAIRYVDTHYGTCRLIRGDATTSSPGTRIQKCCAVYSCWLSSVGC